MHLKAGWKRIFEERLSVCLNCEQRISGDKMKSNVSLTCRMCFGQFHKYCLQKVESPKKSKMMNYIICIKCEKSCETSLDLTYTTMASSQLRIPFESVPSATNRLLSAATQYSMRRNSWTWGATLEELKAQSECLSKMPNLGERMRLKQTRSYSDSRISCEEESSDRFQSKQMKLDIDDELENFEKQNNFFPGDNKLAVPNECVTDESFRKSSFTKTDEPADSGVFSYGSVE